MVLHHYYQKGLPQEQVPCRMCGRFRRPLLRAGGWGTGDAVWRSEPLLAVRLSAETRVRCARGACAAWLPALASGRGAAKEAGADALPRASSKSTLGFAEGETAYM